MRRIAAVLGLVMMAGTSAAEALPPLSQNDYINHRLISARVADRIRKTCPDISARIFYAYSQARALERYALDLGYSKQQIEAFIDSDVEKTRVKAAAEDYLKANGATPGNIAGFCALGREEIAKKSIAGSLLRAR